MDPDKRADYLQGAVRSHYTAKVGETIEIALPTVPMTAETEFVKIVSELQSADQASIAATGGSAKGEGTLSPNRLMATGIKPGRSRIVIRAQDAISNEPINTITPLEITVDVK
jgi:predicted metalloenzyme YecM